MISSSAFGDLQTLLLVSLLSLWLYWLWTRRNLYIFTWQFPGYFGLPILGSLPQIGTPSNTFKGIEKLLQNRKLRTISTWLGLYPYLLTDEPDFIESVLKSPDLLNKTSLYEPILRAFKGGIIASPANKWMHNRKLINPCFTHKVLLSFLPIFHKAKNNIITKINALEKNKEHDLSNIIQNIIWGVTAETTMGRKPEEGNPLDYSAIKRFQYLQKVVTMQAFFGSFKLSRLLDCNTRFIKEKNYIYSYVNDLINQKLQRLNETKTDNSQVKIVDNNNASEDDVASIKKAQIFIDQAIEIYQKNQFTSLDVISESNTIIIAAFETTATIVFSTLVMLAMHPEIQERLFEEITNVFPQKDFVMEYHHMEQLPYLERVINETLRLTPGVPIIGRKTVKPTKITKNLTIPPDMEILISIFTLHRRPDIWGPNAHKFDPDNFLPENVKNRHPYSYIPFSKGVRNCIGWRYALFSLKVIIAGLVRNFKFTTNFKYEDLEFGESISIQLLKHPLMQVHSRN